MHFYLFADDTDIYYEAETMKKLETVINKELKKLDMWLIVNKMVLNIAKTQFLTINKVVGSGSSLRFWIVHFL